MIATKGEYKGHALIQFHKSKEDALASKKPAMSMGVRKAKIVLAHIEDVKKFVEQVEAENMASVQAGQTPQAPKAPEVPQTLNLL